MAHGTKSFLSQAVTAPCCISNNETGKTTTQHSSSEPPSMASIDSPLPVPLTLEFRGEKDVASSRRQSCEVKKIDTPEDGIKFVVSMPRLVDAEQANLTAHLVLEEIDRLPVPAVVERITLDGLRFTTEGVAGINVFLAIHAVTVKHVVLSDIFCGLYTADSDSDALPLLSKAFEDSKLESLNLSNNVLDGSIWKSWTQQTALQQLILDYVEINDASMQEMADNFFFGHSLRDLHIVLNKAMGEKSLEAANRILKSCTRLGSLRWVNKNFNRETSKLPWYGLRAMACSHMLIHLVMEGGSLSEEEIGDRGLCGAVAQLQNVLTLKLRHLSLQDNAIRRITGALCISRPPLESLDLSNNFVQDGGATALAELAQIQRLTKNFVSLSLEKNQIGNEGAKDVMTSFISKVGAKLDLRMRGNPFDYGKIAVEMAVAKRKVETERDELRKECERLRQNAHDAHQNLRKVVAAQTHMIADMHILQQETKHLTEERETLSRAFCVLGNVQAVDERKQMLGRISKLEEMVLGHVVAKPLTSSSSLSLHLAAESSHDAPQMRPSMQSIGELEVMATTNKRPIHVGRSHSVEQPYPDNTYHLSATSFPPPDQLLSPPNIGRPRVMIRASSERWGKSSGGGILKNPSPLGKHSPRGSFSGKASPNRPGGRPITVRRQSSQRSLAIKLEGAMSRRLPVAYDAMSQGSSSRGAASSYTGTSRSDSF